METLLASYRLFPTGTEFIELTGRTNVNMPYPTPSRKSSPSIPTECHSTAAGYCSWA
jgi:hypothetical protein